MSRHSIYKNRFKWPLLILVFCLLAFGSKLKAQPGQVLEEVAAVIGDNII